MKDISVLFSGGPDSALAALLALERSDKVHLLTFHHRVMGKIGKHRKVIQELKQAFGDERIVEHEEKIDAPLSRFYFKRAHHYVLRYRTFYIPWICGACKMAMHVRTIAYNKAQGISITYDGANIESSSYFPAQMDTYIDVMKKLYESYRMQYDCPVYNVDRTDLETEKYGLVTTRNTKNEHVFFSTQHTCFIGLLIHAHARLYYRPFRGKDRTKHLAGNFLEQIIKDCAPLLPSK